MNELSKKFIKRCFQYSCCAAFAFIDFIFMIVPESTLEAIYKWLLDDIEIFNFFITCEGMQVLSVRIIISCIVFVIIFTCMCIKYTVKKEKMIKRKNYEIRIIYGDIFQLENCYKVISFDECFTSKIGSAPEEIKSSSICGQYLSRYPISDMEQLIADSRIEETGTAKHNSDKKYKCGSVIVRDEYLLVAFSKLDAVGKARMSQEEFKKRLDVLWKTISDFSGDKDICIPIMGAGLTEISDGKYTKQEMLDFLISSYKLSKYKIKKPHKLIIVCQHSDDFSLLEIGDCL